MKIIILYIAAGYSNEATEKKPQHYADENICRPYLLGVCLSEMFSDTVRIMKYNNYYCLSITRTEKYNIIIIVIL